MEQTYQKGLCNNSVRGSTSDLILCRWLTHSPTDKPRELTKSCSEVSNPDSVFPWKERQAVGKRNYPQFYEASGRLLIGQKATRPSSWYMEQKPFSRVSYVMIPLESPHMWRLRMRKQGRNPWMFLMKNETWQQLSRLSTNKTYNVIIAVKSRVGLSRKVIWCSDLYI